MAYEVLPFEVWIFRFKC